MERGNANELLQSLSSVLGPSGLLTSEALRSRATSLWNSKPMTALALVRPQTTSEVSTVLRLCHEASQEVVVVGGGTGPVAGAEPKANQIAVSLERMNQIECIDQENSSCVVQAGTVLQTVQEADRNEGLYRRPISE